MMNKTIKKDQYRHLNPYSNIRLEVVTDKINEKLSLNWLDESNTLLINIITSRSGRVVKVNDYSLLEILIEDSALILGWELGFMKWLVNKNDK